VVTLWIWLLGPALFLAQLVMLRAGERLARRLATDRTPNSAINPIITAILPLMGLVLAFSFSNAAGRLDASRKTILDEVNAIETAWLRVDLAEPEAQPRLRALLQRYTDARIRSYQVIPDPPEYQRQVALGHELLREAWTVGVQGTTVTPNRTLLLSGLNAVGDAAGARVMSLGTHMPPLVVGFLFGAVLVGVLLVGMALAGTGDRHGFHRVIVAAVLSSVVVVILDLEYPRVGFMLLEKADLMLVELRRSMT